jgi:2-polyprenyl-3-methyl-5-hydroxy-6-metoxy-1,4-benzoquinol methylase
MTTGPEKDEPAAAPRCHLCEVGSVTTIPAFERLMRVSSDHLTWARGGRIGVCDRCGGVQKLIDETWKMEIKSIYENYRIYHQSGGVEQATFDQNQGPAATRSARLLKRFTEEFPQPTSGRLLDFGCGNGSLLRAFSAAVPGWSLAGAEWDAKDRAAIESIPGVERLYTGSPADVPGKFDLVTAVHVLEHIPSPRAFLADLRDKLQPGSLLLVQLPDHLQNPFELAIADHASHFSRATIRALLTAAGYEVLMVANDWVARELTIVARPGTGSTEPAEPAGPHSARLAVERLIGWLDSVARSARAEADGAEAFGVFGTATGATWLAGELGDRVRFFVDEDPSRVGRTHLDRPIHAPSGVGPGGTVYVALPPPWGESVARRLSDDRVRYISPPSL